MSILSNILKGVAISISQLVPGVSGGTIAIILGIYDDLLKAVNNLTKEFKKHASLLIQVGSGVLLGMFLFARLIKVLFEYYPAQVSFFFVGIIVGGIPLMYKKSAEKGFKLSNVIFALLGILLVLLMSTDAQDQSVPISTLSAANFVWLFVGGFVTAIALILPGISGSFMLYILGLYNTMLTAIAEINIPVLIPIGIGVLVGTFSTAKILEKLLEKYPGQSYSMILGFIVGSVPALLPQTIPTGIILVQCIILFLLGFVSILFYNQFGDE